MSARPNETREVRQLLRSPAFRDRIAKVAEEHDIPLHVASENAHAFLQEMSASHNERITSGWQRVGRWMLRGFDRLLDEERLLSLRTLDHDHSLIFLISHRSYLDEWAVPPAMAAFGIDAPFGLAGANLNFFPLGNIARRTGMIHIRRSTGDQPVYKQVLRSFIGQLVNNRSNLIWSIEGGRTRTGKLRPPRLGLLRYVIDSLDTDDDHEVYIVPVSILYDQLPSHEIELIASEARGNGKAQEDARWFANYLLGLHRRVGRIYVDFGEPLPLRSRLEQMNLEESNGKNNVERIALEVSHRINLATPVTPTAVVCGALLAVDRALTLDEVVATVAPMARYLTARAWPTAGAADIADRGTIRRTLQDLVRSGVVTCHTGTTSVWRVSPDKHVIASVYRNSAIHTLVSRGIAEVVLSAVERDQESTNAWEKALKIRELLKFEFFFSTRAEFAADLQAEVSLIDPTSNVTHREVVPAQATRYLDEMRPLMAPLVLRPFIDAYAVVADQLLDLGASTKFDEHRFLERCLQVGQQWALQRRMASAESASMEMFRSALRLAHYRDLIESNEPLLAERRRAFADDVEEVRFELERIAKRPSPVRTKTATPA